MINDGRLIDQRLEKEKEKKKFCDLKRTLLHTGERKDCIHA